MKPLMENWRKYLNEKDAPLIGYKIVAYEGGKLYSLQNPDLEYNVKVGTVESPANGMFLGTTEDFVKDYYLEMTDKQDALLIYEYNAEDVISGNLDEEGEVKVTQATLKDIEVIPTEEAKNKDGKEQGADGKACWKGYRYAGTEDGKDKCVPVDEVVDRLFAKLAEKTKDKYDDEVEKRSEKSRKRGMSKMLGKKQELEEEPAKGKKSSKTYTNPDTGRKNKVSYGQKGAKISPGTSKGDSYCARSYGIKKDLPKDKQNDPNTPNNLSRKKWKCKGKKSSK